MYDLSDTESEPDEFYTEEDFKQNEDIILNNIFDDFLLREVCIEKPKHESFFDFYPNEIKSHLLSVERNIPKNSSIHNLLGHYYLYLEDYVRSEEEFLKAAAWLSGTGKKTIRNTSKINKVFAEIKCMESYCVLLRFAQKVSLESQQQVESYEKGKERRLKNAAAKNRSRLNDKDFYFLTLRKTKSNQKKKINLNQINSIVFQKQIERKIKEKQETNKKKKKFHTPDHFFLKMTTTISELFLQGDPILKTVMDELVRKLSNRFQNSFSVCNSHEFFNLLGVFNLLLHKQELAINVFSSASSVFPSYLDICNNLGACLLSRWEDVEQIKFLFQKVLLSDREHPEALNNYAILLLTDTTHGKNRKRISQAIDFYRRALYLQNSAGYWCNLASAYCLGGQGKNSRLCFHKALQLDPKNLNILRNYVRFLMLFGQNLIAEKIAKYILIQQINEYENFDVLENKLNIKKQPLSKKTKSDKRKKKRTKKGKKNDGDSESETDENDKASIDLEIIRRNKILARDWLLMAQILAEGSIENVEEDSNGEDEEIKGKEVKSEKMENREENKLAIDTETSTENSNVSNSDSDSDSGSDSDSDSDLDLDSDSDTYTDSDLDNKRNKNKDKKKKKYKTTRKGKRRRIAMKRKKRKRKRKKGKAKNINIEDADNESSDSISEEKRRKKKQLKKKYIEKKKKIKKKKKKKKKK
ncbi:e3 ubiquitin-protein ligase rbbp6 [Anaeramoeba flamelloides]|uniref:E3 ubiquitin-protein ligase rbbp6 n=1 Tax=Anaeramoeba flamelloides TaxID=1746091 RepID=A0AAV8A7N5_9EUKA|nr:e3 ubiquitin-protein ligase rbbp6 [Anaeramoeba flamelloides]